MGPGAGTSLIGGKAIAFANVIKRGEIGIVAAAGTGLQEISVLLSEAGLGVSEGLGTGGGDVKGKIGGLMMLQSIDALEHDPETKTIVIVSKPPDPTVKELMLEHIASHTKKQYVTCFLGRESFDIPSKARKRMKATKSLHAAFAEAIRIADPDHQAEVMKRFTLPQSELIALAKEEAKKLVSGQRFIRGLYTGGTLAYETLIILEHMIGGVYSNAPLDSKFKLADSYRSVQDSIIDLGEEEFTAGRAHPMIDPTIRKIRLIEEAKDEEVAVVLMDVMLGYGSHPDPAGAMLSAIMEAKKVAESNGRAFPILAHVCGTELDPQHLSDQVARLRKAGVQVFPTNATMAIAAALISRRSAFSSEVLDDIYRHFLVGFQ
jgi:succinyl-CoA synthetase alpha subunit